jgi:hypothetical protein
MDGLLGGCLSRNALLLGSLIVFGVHQAAIAGGWSAPWADSYLDTFLFLPIALGLPAWALRLWQPDFRWNPRFIAGAWAAASLAFEVWIPSFDTRFTADALDSVCYAFGAWVFWRTEAGGRQ